MQVSCQSSGLPCHCTFFQGRNHQHGCQCAPGLIWARRSSARRGFHADWTRPDRVRHLQPIAKRSRRRSRPRGCWCVSVRFETEALLTYGWNNGGVVGAAGPLAPDATSCSVLCLMNPKGFRPKNTQRGVPQYRAFPGARVYICQPQPGSEGDRRTHLAG